MAIKKTLYFNINLDINSIKFSIFGLLNQLLFSIVVIYIILDIAFVLVNISYHTIDYFILDNSSFNTVCSMAGESSSDSASNGTSTSNNTSASNSTSTSNIPNNTNTTNNSTSTSNIPNNTTTSREFIFNNNSWSSVVRSIFIYGSAGILVHASRNPRSIPFAIAGTVVGELSTQVVNNVINDPSYVRDHILNWKMIWDNITKGDLAIKVDRTTENDINNILKGKGNSSNFIDNNTDLDILSTVLNNLKPILEPIKVTYSTELLADQIYHISIMLFLISVIVIVFFFIFTFSSIVLIFKDRILNYFNNKYILAYIRFQTRIMVVEIIFLFVVITYFLSTISRGLHFIATHPININ